MDRVIGFGVRGISKGIAVTSEVIAARKDKASENTLRNQQVNTHESEEEDGEESVDAIDLEWELDEAGTDVLPNHDESNSKSSNPARLALAGTIPSPNSLKPLPLPVILPQRRPGTRSRGFIRAYAPSLGECSQLDSDTFLEFLNNFDRASKASPIFDVINIACFGVGLVPSSICFAVSTSVGTASKFAQEIQGRYRANKFLDDVNETLFRPRGLYCMVMAYRPDLPEDAILRADVSEDVHGVALQKILGREDGGLKQKFALLRKTSGVARGDHQMPTPAPLVYPALDRAMETAAATAPVSTGSSGISWNDAGPVAANNSVSQNTGNAGAAVTQSSSATPLSKLSALANNPVVQDYLDRRAQSNFIHTNPNSKLATTLPPQKQYVNRFADPNHPANSGSLFGLLSGGTFDPIASGRVRRAERKARRKGESTLTTHEKHDAYMGRKVRGRTTGTPSKNGPIAKILRLKHDVLYLVVVNMPSEQDVQSVMGQFD